MVGAWPISCRNSWFRPVSTTLWANVCWWPSAAARFNWPQARCNQSSPLAGIESARAETWHLCLGCSKVILNPYLGLRKGPLCSGYPIGIMAIRIGQASILNSPVCVSSWASLVVSLCVQCECLLIHLLRWFKGKPKGQAPLQTAPYFDSFVKGDYTGKDFDTQRRLYPNCANGTCPFQLPFNLWSLEMDHCAKGRVTEQMQGFDFVGTIFC